MADAVADRLLALNIPFIFTSGYEDAALRKRYPRITNCQKPYAFERIEEALLGAMSGASSAHKNRLKFRLLDCGRRNSGLFRSRRR